MRAEIQAELQWWTAWDWSQPIEDKVCRLRRLFPDADALLLTELVEVQS